MTADKMNPEVKAKWVAALRSGDYVQGEGVLIRSGIDGKRFCCLGVLCDIAVKDGIIEAPKSYRENSTGVLYFEEGSETRTRLDGSDFEHVVKQDAFLPSKVAVWAGFDVESPRVRATVEEWDDYAERDRPIERDLMLSELNDGYNKSFAELADLIEAQL